MDRPLTVGAVMYDPKVSVIWEIIRDFFDSQALSDRRRVLQHLRAAGRGPARPARSTSPGTRRSRGSTRSAGPAAPAAPSRCATPIAIACRTSSRARDGPVRTLADLRGRTLATGAIDSPQATLIPLGRLRRDGLDPAATSPSGASTSWSASTAITSAASATRSSACSSGDAAACAMLDLNWDGWTKDGTIDAGRFRSSPRPIASITASSRSASDLDAAAERRWLDALFAMRYDNPAHREMMDLEGLKAWLPGRTTRLRPADRGGRAGAFLRAESRVSELPLFPVTTVGSWPRPPQVAEALRAVSPAAHRPRRVRSGRRRRRWSKCCGCRTSSGATS